MTLSEALRELEAAGTEQNRKIYRRHGFEGEQFGVSFGNLQKLAKQIRKDNSLAGELWKTGNGDARNLAVLIADPKTLSAKTIQQWIAGVTYYVHADMLGSKVASKHADAAAIMRDSMSAKADFVQQVGWDTAAALSMDGKLSDADANRLLGAIEKSIHKAPNRARHAMNSALIAFGLRGPAFKKKAIASARRIGKVDVDHGETGCVTPDAESYILKASARKKKK